MRSDVSWVAGRLVAREEQTRNFGLFYPDGRGNVRTEFGDGGPTQVAGQQGSGKFIEVRCSSESQVINP